MAEKATKAKATKAKAPAEPSPERLSVLNLKGSPEFRDWLNEASEKTRIPIATIVRDSLGMWAESRGLSKPPRV